MSFLGYNTKYVLWSTDLLTSRAPDFGKQARIQATPDSPELASAEVAELADALA